MTVEVPRGATLAGRPPPERVVLVDLLDRLLAGGVVISGDLVLSIADIDLVRISLRALIMSVRACEPLEMGVRHAEIDGAVRPLAHGNRPRYGRA